jgi:hypothetical protein
VNSSDDPRNLTIALIILGNYVGRLQRVSPRECVNDLMFFFFFERYGIAPMKRAPLFQGGNIKSDLG